MQHSPRLLQCSICALLQAPRFLLELCLAITRMLQSDLLACTDFASAAHVLKTIGERVSDPAELTLLTRSPECSLQSHGIAAWRTTYAPAFFAPPPPPPGAQHSETSTSSLRRSAVLGASTSTSSTAGGDDRDSSGGFGGTSGSHNFNFGGDGGGGFGRLLGGRKRTRLSEYYSSSSASSSFSSSLSSGADAELTPSSALSPAAATSTLAGMPSEALNVTRDEEAVPAVVGASRTSDNEESHAGAAPCAAATSTSFGAACGGCAPCDSPVATAGATAVASACGLSEDASTGGDSDDEAVHQLQLGVHTPVSLELGLDRVFSPIAASPLAKLGAFEVEVVGPLATTTAIAPLSAATAAAAVAAQSSPLCGEGARGHVSSSSPLRAGAAAAAAAAASRNHLLRASPAQLQLGAPRSPRASPAQLQLGASPRSPIDAMRLLHWRRLTGAGAVLSPSGILRRATAAVAAAAAAAVAASSSYSPSGASSLVHSSSSCLTTASPVFESSNSGGSGPPLPAAISSYSARESRCSSVTGGAAEPATGRVVVAPTESIVAAPPASATAAPVTAAPPISGSMDANFNFVSRPRALPSVSVQPLVNGPDFNFVHPLVSGTDVVSGSDSEGGGEGWAGRGDPLNCSSAIDSLGCPASSPASGGGIDDDDECGAPGVNFNFSNGNECGAQAHADVSVRSNTISSCISSGTGPGSVTACSAVQPQQQQRCAPLPPAPLHPLRDSDSASTSALSGAAPPPSTSALPVFDSAALAEGLNDSVAAGASKRRRLVTSMRHHAAASGSSVEAATSGAGRWSSDNGGEGSVRATSSSSSSSSFFGAAARTPLPPASSSLTSTGGGGGGGLRLTAGFGFAAAAMAAVVSVPAPTSTAAPSASSAMSPTGVVRHQAGKRPRTGHTGAPSPQSSAAAAAAVKPFPTSYDEFSEDVDDDNHNSSSGAATASAVAQQRRVLGPRSSPAAPAGAVLAVQLALLSPPRTRLTRSSSACTPSNSSNTPRQQQALQASGASLTML